MSWRSSRWAFNPRDVFSPQPLWRLPLNGLHEYALPATIAERLLDPVDLAHSLAAAPIELIVFATDVSEPNDGTYELAFSSRETPAETMVQRCVCLGSDQRARPAAACR